MKERVVDVRASGDGAALPAPLWGWTRACVWLLPIWGLLLAASTLTHQPDYEADFQGYAEYVTTDSFLVSHLLLSIVGAALAAVGGAALGVGLAATPAARSVLWGMSAFAASQVLTASVFGVAAFFQPAVGRAFLEGDEAVARSINEEVYGAEVFAMVGAGMLLMIVGAVLLGRGAVRSGVAPVWAGRLFAGAVPLFAVSGFTFDTLQPIAGLLVAASGFALAKTLSAPVRDREASRPS